jgi:glycosyltransferase involved in cell wall biosynthesis
MKRICVLTNAPIKNDGRVKKMVRFYAEIGLVDLFYIDGEPDDNTLFSKNVNLFCFKSHESKNVFEKLKNALLFFNSFNFYYNEFKKIKYNYDIVVANDLPTLKPAYKIAIANNATLVYDSHEIYIETIYQFYPPTKNIFKKTAFSILIEITRLLGTSIEAKCIKKANIFITVNETIAKYFEKKYKVNKVLSIKNCPVTKHFENSEIVDIRKQFDLTNKEILFLYQGVINQGRCLELFIRSLAKTPNNIHFFLIGYGDFKGYLLKLSEELGLKERVHFLGVIPNDELYKYTPAFDFGVNLGGGNLSKDYGLSNKLFEYMHARLPIICSDNPENRIIFSKYPVGYLTNNSEEDVSRGIIKLCSKNDHNYYKNNCKIAANEYCWENEIVTLQKELSKFII